MNPLPPPGLPIGALREKEPSSLPAPKRRLRDRLAERDGTNNPSLAERYELTNLLLLIDDDLRETALALTGIERFLGDALQLLDHEGVRPVELVRLAQDGDVLDRMDTLAETLTQLRRRLQTVGKTIG
jgi:hypothetical protein